jgi:hypothetical protein
MTTYFGNYAENHQSVIFNIHINVSSLLDLCILRNDTLKGEC